MCSLAWWLAGPPNPHMLGFARPPPSSRCLLTHVEPEPRWPASRGGPVLHRRLRLHLVGSEPGAHARAIREGGASRTHRSGRRFPRVETSPYECNNVDVRTARFHGESCNSGQALCTVMPDGARVHADRHHRQDAGLHRRRQPVRLPCKPTPGADSQTAGRSEPASAGNGRDCYRWSSAASAAATIATMPAFTAGGRWSQASTTWVRSSGILFWCTLGTPWECSEVSVWCAGSAGFCSGDCGTEGASV